MKHIINNSSSSQRDQYKFPDERRKGAHLTRLHSLSPIVGALLVTILATSLLTSCGMGKGVSAKYIPLHPVTETRAHAGVGKYPDSACVWKVENKQTNQHLYLAGTTHVLDQDDLPLPSPYYAAYHLSDVLITEDKTVGVGLLSAVKLPFWFYKNKDHFTEGAGELESRLEPETLALLKKYYKEDYEHEVKDSSPLFLYLSLSFNLSEKSDKGGVESLFEELAERDDKSIRGLDESSVVALALSTMDKMVTHFVEKSESGGLDELIRKKLTNERESRFASIYRKGDRAVMKKADRALQKTLSDSYAKLLTERNENWHVKIKKMLKPRSKIVEYVLVGASHLEGEKGLLTLLEKDGYQVTQLYGVDRPASLSKGGSELTDSK